MELFSYNGKGLHIQNPSWERRQMNSGPLAWARDDSVGLASATDGSRWRAADLCGATLADARPETCSIDTS